MSRMYSAVFEEVAVSAAQDLFEVNTSTGSAVVVHALEVTQSSDAGDKESEQLNVLIHRGTTSGSGGSSVTPRPLEAGDPAFGGSVEANNTSQSTEGVILWSSSFNVMAGLIIWWTPETRPVISPSSRLIVELQSTPNDALTMSGVLVFEEIGG